MADHDLHPKAVADAVEPREAVEQKEAESLIEKINEKIHHHGDDSSSSSSSDDDSKKKKKKKSSSPKSAVLRLFGRQKPVHKVLGGGKGADVLMWRNKKVSAGVLGVATAIWVLFEVIEYHFLTLVCHGLILCLAVMYLWSNVSTFIHKSPPKIPEVVVPEKPILQFASDLRFTINEGFAVGREIASGRDLKQFLLVIAGLWFFSVLGSCCDFLTLVYITTLLLHTVPVLYDTYEDEVDAFGEKALAEIKKQYAVFDHKVLSKIPRGAMKKKD